MTEEKLLEGLRLARDRLMLEDDIDTVIFTVKRGNDIFTVAQAKGGRSMAVRVAKIAWERVRGEASAS